MEKKFLRNKSKATLNPQCEMSVYQLAATLNNTQKKTTNAIYVFFVFVFFFLAFSDKAKTEFLRLSIDDSKWITGLAGNMGEAESKYLY